MQKIIRTFKKCISKTLRKLLISVLLVLFTGSIRVYGEEVPERYIGVRPAGMGNAFTALANDHNSIWTNPAGVARIRKARSRKGVNMFQAPNITGGYNYEGRRLYESVQSQQGTPGDKSEKLASALSSLGEDVTEKAIWGRASTLVGAFFDMPKGSPWAIAAFTNNKLKAVVDEDDSSRAQVDSVSDFGLVLNTTWTNQTNRFQFGVQVRPTLRYDYFEKVSVAQLVDKTLMQKKIQNDSNGAQALGVDLGMLWTFADFWFPTIGLSVLNAPTGCKEDYLNSFAEVRQKVCGTVYKGSINNPESVHLIDPTDIRVGLSITPRLTQKWAIRFALDYHHGYIDMNNWGQNQFIGLAGIEPLKQVHAGAEFFIGNPLLLNPISARVGFNQGFMTVGASLRLGFMSIEFAAYGQDISSTPKGREDRRYLLSISADFI